MSNYVTDYQIAKKQFELFCERRDLLVAEFRTSPKNPKHFLGTAYSEVGDEEFYLISENGNYNHYDRVRKKWYQVPYVLEDQQKMR